MVLFIIFHWSRYVDFGMMVAIEVDNVLKRICCKPKWLFFFIFYLPNCLFPWFCQIIFKNQRNKKRKIFFHFILTDWYEPIKLSKQKQKDLWKYKSVPSNCQVSVYLFLQCFKCKVFNTLSVCNVKLVFHLFLCVWIIHASSFIKHFNALLFLKFDDLFSLHTPVLVIVV